ncbi:MAG: hypothetical protein WKF73_19600 [Nocardioidaceae bacterium]
MWTSPGRLAGRAATPDDVYLDHPTDDRDRGVGEVTDVGGQPGVCSPGRSPHKLGSGVEEFRDGILIDYVGGYGEGADASRAGSGGDLLDGICAAEVPDDDVVPALGEVSCGGCSDAAASTGDDGQRSRRNWYEVILPHGLEPAVSTEAQHHGSWSLPLPGPPPWCSPRTAAC